MPASGRAVGAGLVVALIVGCASADYYRMPQTPGAAGSIANEVEYAYFSIAKPRFGMPLAYTEFNPDIDEHVVFFAGVQTRRPTVVLRGVLYRPDGAEQASFSRTESPYPRGPYYNVGIDESFPMTALQPHIGRWALKLFLDDTLVGIYEFVLADKSRLQEFRRPR